MVRHRGSNRIIDSYQEEDRTDSKLLLIGPSSVSYGQSEVLSLTDLTPLNCNIPVFPGWEYWGYVGRSTSDGVLMCGGRTSSGYTSSCYLLTSSGYQDMPGLSIRRNSAASVVTPLGLWVTGGYDGYNNHDTTELVTNNQSWSHVRLPDSMYGHCMVSINQTHYLLTGGYTRSGYSRSAYLYSEDGGFSKIEDMNTRRQFHGCSVINNNTVIVTGGHAGTSSELLDLTTMTWSTGPKLPEYVAPARMVGNILIGEEKIFKLEETMAQGKQWRWSEMQEMTDTRRHAQAFVVDQNMFCKN